MSKFLWYWQQGILTLCFYVLDDYDDEDDQESEASGDLKPRNDDAEIGDQEESIPLMDFQFYVFIWANFKNGTHRV